MRHCNLSNTRFLGWQVLQFGVDSCFSNFAIAAQFRFFHLAPKCDARVQRHIIPQTFQQQPDLGSKPTVACRAMPSSAICMCAPRVRMGCRSSVIPCCESCCMRWSGISSQAERNALCHGPVAAAHHPARLPHRLPATDRLPPPGTSTHEMNGRDWP